MCAVIRFGYIQIPFWYTLLTLLFLGVVHVPLLVRVLLYPNPVLVYVVHCSVLGIVTRCTHFCFGCCTRSAFGACTRCTLFCFGVVHCSAFGSCTKSRFGTSSALGFVHFGYCYALHTLPF